MKLSDILKKHGVNLPKEKPMTGDELECNCENSHPKDYHGYCNCDFSFNDGYNSCIDEISNLLSKEVEEVVPLDEDELYNLIEQFNDGIRETWKVDNDKRFLLPSERRLLAEQIYLKFGQDRKEVTGETSDGYHTFNELYEHRVLLWINYCLLNKEKCYLVPNHFDGWFLLGMKTSWGQISYHCPNKYYGMIESIKIEHPEFDGHTPNDVTSRLESLAVRNR